MTFTIDTITTNKTIRLKVIRPVFENLVIKEEALPEYLRKKTIKSSADVYHLFGFLTKETKEHFIAIHLDSKNKILCIDRVSTGSLSAAVVHPREVLKSTLLSSAAAILVLHNHPSGNPEPSSEDLELSSRLKECCELIGIRLLDSVIVGTDGYVSLADRGLI
ncbi:JAB domain-containing protein [Deltaproteobacteria bacterium IMCC39524]|nr:JAB domain-containing protein [Deltaproteobacteria bacterium IMCC39524]